jgi:hypothetical protein
VTLMEFLYNVLTVISADYNLFINCGGNKMNFEGNEYEMDIDPSGRSQFNSYSEKWGYSSMGVPIGKNNGFYLAKNTFSLNVTSIYETARLAPSIT